jgi:hypothetical protein
LEGDEEIAMDSLLVWLGGIALVGAVAYLVTHKLGST